MDERVARHPLSPEPPDKLVQFPVGQPAMREGRGRGVRKYGWAGVILSLLVVMALAVAWWTLGETDTVRYTAAPVTTGPVTRTITATGTVNPELTVIVGTYVSGVIQDLYCDYNTEVKKGQVCAKIDPRPYQTVVDEAKASLAVAKAQREKDEASLTYARLAFERATKLVRSNAISQDAFDNAKSAYEQARAQVTFAEATIEQRQAALEAAQVNLSYTDITSPVDGTVVSRSVTRGQTVAASFQTPTLFLIATDLTKMQVDTNVSESDIGEVKVGERVNFTVDAFPKRIFQGVVSQVRQSPQMVQNVVTYDAVVNVENSDLALKPGMTSATRLIFDQRDDVIRVPNLALRYRPGGLSGDPMPEQAQVWVLRDGKAMAVRVIPGLADDSFTEIVSGNVGPGDQVITAEQSVERKTVIPRLRF